MTRFLKLKADAQVTIDAVVAAIARLSTYSEAEIISIVSAGKIQKLFPFHPALPDEIPADTVDESELVEASAMPLNGERPLR
jgi:hypothetical protein